MRLLIGLSMVTKYKLTTKERHNIAEAIIYHNLVSLCETGFLDDCDELIGAGETKAITDDILKIADKYQNDLIVCAAVADMIKMIKEQK